MKENDRIDRIRAMEEAFDAASAAVRALSDTPDGYEEAREALDRLTEYYGSPLWREDFEADEAGLLPPDLKRGVLGEDGVWNLLDERKALHARICSLAADTEKSEKSKKEEQ
ncbi:MAG: DUF4298 domain-containing protein [Clostridia bacterium]|nr:DUF4298 domain-containing protein [Clostridia bacterium]